MAATEQLQPLSPASNMAPTDPNVVIPQHIKDAALAADALHKQLYSPEPTAPVPVPAQATDEDQAAAAAAEAERARVAEEAARAAPPTNQPQEPADDPSVTREEWRRRFLSMQGRYQQSQRTVGSMEQQMTELGQELQRTQQLLNSGDTHAPAPTPSGQTHKNLITEGDREAYGDELIDLARRAAMETVGPEIENLRAENKRLTERVGSTGKREMFGQLDRAVPQWRQINKHPHFLSWLRLPNVYTGTIRGDMLNSAVAGAEAPKVIALFRDFIAEANATGQQAPAAREEHPAVTPAPREPALSLDALAAPGKARPASGDGQVPPEKPLYSRAQISKFYDDKRKGLWAGRETEANQIEQDIIVAQGQGRIR